MTSFGLIIVVENSSLLSSSYW